MKTNKKTLLLLATVLCLFFFLSKSTNKNINTATFIESNTSSESIQVTDNQLLNPKGKTLKTRFLVPKNFKRVTPKPNSFGHYLQNLPLKKHGSVVHYYNGATKDVSNVYVAVANIDVGERDLQQCADAIMRLRAEHLLAQKQYKDIHFNFTNGFRVDYDRWKQGFRVRIKGNKTTWYKATKPDGSYKNFRKYMNLVFAYAGTLSLSKELQSVAFEDLQIGDILIQGGSPGHAVIVVDMAIKKGTGDKIFLLAQSYMPAQEIQILYTKNGGLNDFWYDNTTQDQVILTPEWTFSTSDLKRFAR